MNNDQEVNGYIVSNQTAKRIGIECKDDEVCEYPFILPPFGVRRVSAQVKEQFDFNPWVQQNLIVIKEENNQAKKGSDTKMALGCISWIFLIGLPVGFSISIFRGSYYYWGSLGLLFIVFLIIGLSGQSFNDLWASTKNKFSILIRWIFQTLSLQLVLIIGIGLPLAVIFFYGQGQVYLYGPHIEKQLLSDYFLLGRLFQLVFIAMASLLPALLYYLFDRQRIGTLRKQFYHDIILLDPAVVTLGAAEAMYGRRVDEVYGPEQRSHGKRYLSTTRWPIIVATLVITLGWIYALMPLQPIHKDFKLDELYALLIPNTSPVIFGFLGMYFFALNMVFRRYVRSDLKPKAYSHITIRFFSVIILVWTLNVIFSSFSDDAGSTMDIMKGMNSSVVVLNVLAFMVGMIPETGTAVIQGFLRAQKWLGKLIPSMYEKNPLSKLEGITLYDQARLLEEGIENIENLVHHDLVDLILQTRIPVQRLLDWIDQGILYLHVVDSIHPDALKPAEKGSDEEVSPPGSLYKILRSYGARTATDLQQAYTKARKRDEKGSGELEHFLGILDTPNIYKGELMDQQGHSAPGVRRLQIIIDCLSDDEWFNYLEKWRIARNESLNKIYSINEFFN